METKYTFDDVLISPNKSSIIPSEVELNTNLTKKIKLNIPIISAAMDTVTESRMAIAIAKLGGLGIIHRNLSIESQIKEVKKVKYSQSLVIDKPITISPHSTLQEVEEKRKRFKVSGFPVVDSDNKLLGILTNRDTRFAEKNKTETVDNFMTKIPLVTAKKGIKKHDAAKLLQENKIEKLPVVSDNGTLIGLITIKDYIKTQKFPNATKDKFGRLMVGASIGFYGKSAFERAEELVKAGVDVIVIDTAHADTKIMLETIKKIRKLNVQIVAGNIGTESAAKSLIKAGVDAIKVGIGPGSICTTRIIAGVGVPQISAIFDVSKAAKKAKVPIIADGGVRYSGDISKAIVAGASSVMLGSMLAGCEESPGELMFMNGKQYKKYRGMGSNSVINSKTPYSKDRYFHLNNDSPVPEGVEAGIPYSGSLSNVLHQILGGIKQTMFYTGSKTIIDLQNKGELIKITGAGLKESHPHDISIMQEAPNYSKK